MGDQRRRCCCCPWWRSKVWVLAARIGWRATSWTGWPDKRGFCESTHTWLRAHYLATAIRATVSTRSQQWDWQRRITQCSPARRENDPEDRESSVVVHMKIEQVDQCDEQWIEPGIRCNNWETWTSYEFWTCIWLVTYGTILTTYKTRTTYMYSTILIWAPIFTLFSTDPSMPFQVRLESVNRFPHFPWQCLHPTAQETKGWSIQYYLEGLQDGGL